MYNLYINYIKVVDKVLVSNSKYNFFIINNCMEKTFKNLENYRNGKEPLRNAVLQHPTGNDIYDYIQKKVERNFWVIPFAKWQKIQKYRK